MNKKAQKVVKEWIEERLDISEVKK